MQDMKSLNDGCLIAQSNRWQFDLFGVCPALRSLSSFFRLLRLLLVESMVPPTIYEGTFVHNVSLTELEIIEDGCIAVDENGVIVSIFQKAEKPDVEADSRQKLNWTTVAAKSASNGFWFPGFIGGWHACPLSPRSFESRYSYPCLADFQCWHIWQDHTAVMALHLHLSSRVGVLLHRDGQIGICVLHRPHLGLWYHHCGILYHHSYRIHQPSRRPVLPERTACLRWPLQHGLSLHPDYYQDASPESAIEDTRATIDHIQSLDPDHELITPIITPRFAPSCTPQLLRRLGDLHSATGLPIQTHLSENMPEIELVRGLFPDQSSYAEVYNTYGLLTSRTLFAHACHLSQEEMALISARNAKISHCPVSNSSLASGICPVRELLGRGIDVGLGTDVSGGYSTSILVAAREAAIASRSLTLMCPPGTSQEAKDHLKLSFEECLYLATRGGAKCLGLGAKVGGFQLGMAWDAQYIDLGETMSEGHGGRGGVALWGWESWPEKVAKWMFCGDDRNTMAVWIRGRLVHGNM